MKTAKQLPIPRPSKAKDLPLTIKENKKSERLSLTGVMKLSWEIQREKHRSRSRSLMNAWVIFQNRDIAMFYLTLKHKHRPKSVKIQPAQISLFSDLIFTNL